MEKHPGGGTVGLESRLQAVFALDRLKPGLPTGFFRTGSWECVQHARRHSPVPFCRALRRILNGKETETPPGSERRLPIGLNR